MVVCQDRYGWPRTGYRVPFDNKGFYLCHITVVFFLNFIHTFDLLSRYPFVKAQLQLYFSIHCVRQTLPI